ncbi:MAG TPA: GerMN domain-containing protein [Candidatus Mediterraneibacter merdipullorum]|nr:GerMN domain-containing protein [Candidatus Mediterraneibacter merdipullorum]
MMKKWISPAALLAGTALLLSACAGDEKEPGRESFIYCLNEDRTGIVEVEYDFSGEDAAETAGDILERLREPAEDIEYLNPIPEEVEVQDYELSGSILEVDFSREYLDVEQIQEKLMRAAIVQSLVQVDGINGVMFTVDGAALTDSDGLEIGLMNEDDFVENTSSSPSSYQTDTLTLYFASESGDRLVEQQVDVRYSSNVSKDKLIVEKLMQGPRGSGAYPVINPDANLLSVTTKDGICYVNFDSSFLTASYDVTPEVTVYSIVNSLAEGTEAMQVQITVNGETNAEYMETVDLSQPLEPDMELIAADEGDE